MTTTKLGRYWHLLTFAVAVFAIVFQLYLVATGENILDSSAVTTTVPEQIRRFASYFTIQANMLVAVSMFMIITRRTGSQVFRVVRLASLIGITVTGLVAAVALPPSPNYTTGSLICDRLLHIVVPVLTFVGWVAFGPRGKVHREDLVPSLIWPVVWLVATLALAPLVDWYPYPFINPNAVGVGRVVINCIAIAVLFFALAFATRWADQHLPGEREPARR